ncbi:MAG: fused MFS/spermidine synthase [Nitrospinales bacterium]
MKNLRPRFWVFLFFFLSGVTGLIYEVVWTRLLTLVMGNTHYSVATVLTAFMGGLALGSFLGGRLIDRGFDPLKVYAFLEFCIGVYCFFVPALTELALPLFKWIYAHYQDVYPRAAALRFLVCGVILLVPTAFMGATLPALSKFVARDTAFIGRDVGGLYAVNTFGAVLGALSSAFVLMPWLGLRTTIGFAAVVNIAIALTIVLFVSRARGGGRQPAVENLPEVARENPAGEGGAGRQGRLILWVFGFSGVAAMVYQVAWNRIFSLVLGSSVYAFSLIVTTFVLGLALGAAVFSRLCGLFGNRVKALGLLQVGIGVSAFATLPLLGSVPLFNRWVYQNFGVEFALVQWSHFLIIFAFLFVPTFLMGGQFPVVIKIVAGSLSRVGRGVADAYAANTVGAIFGSFVGGFILLPWMGIQNSILGAAGLNIVLGVVLLLFASGPAFKRYVLPPALILCLLGARAVPAWDKAVISSGSFMPYRIGDLDEALRKTNKILFYREGLHVTVTTELAVSGNIFLRVNGKTDASLALDMRTQLLSGYLPLFFHKRPDSVLVIGQGSGVTLGAVEQFPVKSVDLVEISGAVIDGSRFFAPFNHHALDDRRVRLILEDGRNHIALTDKKYDVIISEPSNPWISGVGALFTREFFDLSKKRLNPGGIICIWVHTNMSPDNFKSVTGTFAAVFPYVSMWESIVGDDYLLIGSEEPYRLPYAKVQALLHDNPVIRKDLGGIGVGDVRDLMSLMAVSTEGLKKFSRGAPIHTDDNLLLEFQAPRYIYKDERAVLVRQMTPFFKVDPDLLDFSGADAATRERVLGEMLAVKRSESQVGGIKRRARIEVLLEQALKAFNQGSRERALEIYSKILALDPEHVMTWLNRGNVYLDLGRFAEAEAAYKKTLALNPYYIFGSIALGKLYLRTGRFAEAEGVLRKVNDWHPHDAEVRVYLGLAYVFQKRMEQALAEFETAVALDPDLALAHYYLGIHYRRRKPGRAEKHLKRFLRLAGSVPGDEKLIANAEKLLRSMDN